MRVLLVQPRPRRSLGLQSTVCSEPLGLEIVASALTEAYHEVKLLDMLDGRLPTELVKEFDPQAIGISCTFTVDTYQVLELAQKLHQIAPKAFIFVGGHHATLDPESLFHPAINAIVTGEGETTTPELISALEGKEDLSRVKGLILNNYPEGQISTGVRPLLADLDKVPFPRRDLTSRYRKLYFLGLRRPLVTVETSRGCPYRCNFCSVWRFHQGKFRAMSPERVVEELAQLPPGDVLFADDNFLANIPRVCEIISLIKRRRLPKRRYIIQARSDTIVANSDVIAEFREVGLDHIFIGFEKVDQEGLDSVEKRNSIENNERAFKLLQSMGIGVYASFIVDPKFTEAGFKKLCDYVKRLGLQQSYFSILTPLPGTKLYEQLKDQLTTLNYELFDLLHAVLPTELPLSQFYQEFVNLYRKVYLKPSIAVSTLWQIFRDIFTKGLSVRHLWQLWRGVRLTANPHVYLAAHNNS
ncbi:MAG: B12-binding domain-containing radical SAM protein [Thermacetogeniaceae bacterium]